MRKADFKEFHMAAVTCPYCGEPNIFSKGETRYKEGEKVTCEHCRYEFLLDKSI